MKKSLAQLKRDADTGSMTLEIIERFGKTGEDIPAAMRGIRKVIRSRSYGLDILNNDGRESTLRLDAKLTDYDGDTLTVYNPLLRDLDDEEQALMAAAEAMDYYKGRSFLANSACPWLGAYELVRGRILSGGKITDYTQRGEIGLRYVVRSITPEVEEQVAAALENARLEAQRRAEEETAREAAYAAERNAEAQVVIDNALDVLKNDGALYNEAIKIYRGVFKYSTYSVVNYLMREYGVNVPLRTQGWINDSLYSLTIRDGSCSHLQYYKSKHGRGSQAIYGYVNELIQAVRNTATEEEIKHLFGEKEDQ